MCTALEFRMFFIVGLSFVNDWTDETRNRLNMIGMTPWICNITQVDKNEILLLRQSFER